MKNFKVKHIMAIGVVLLCILCICFFINQSNAQELSVQEKDNGLYSGFDAFENAAAAIEGSDKTVGVTFCGGYEKASRRFKIELKAHPKNLITYYENAGIAIHEISILKCKVGLRQKNDESNSYIAGIEEIEKQKIKSLQTEGSFRDTCIVFQPQIADAAEFNKLDLPVIFQLCKQNEDEDSDNNDEFYGAIRYKITGTIHNGENISFYVWTKEAIGRAEFVL